MLRTSPYIPLYYRMWNLSTSKMKSIDLKMKSIDLKNEIYRPQKWNLSTQNKNPIDSNSQPICE